MACAWRRPQGDVAASMMGRPPPACSTRPPRIHGSPARRGRGPRSVVLDHGVVVDVGHRRGPCEGAGAGREVPDDDGLEVHHEMAAEGGVFQPRQQQQARRLDGPAGHDDHLASMVRSTPSGPMKSTPVARRPSVTIRETKVSAINSARPVAMVVVSRATGSPLAWMGQPK